MVLLLHKFVVIQDNSMDVLFNGVLVELPTILDNTTSLYIGVVGWGWRAMIVAG